MGTNSTHVDDWVESNYGKHVYPRWFFFLRRLAAALQADWAPYLNQYKLFCTYNDKRYRVTGASRFGDIWLTSNFKQEHGYELRVALDDCSEWSPAEVYGDVAKTTLSLKKEDFEETSKQLQHLRKTNEMVLVSSEELACLLYSEHDSHSALSGLVERESWLQALSSSGYAHPCFPLGVVGMYLPDIAKSWIMHLLNAIGYCCVVVRDRKSKTVYWTATSEVMQLDADILSFALDEHEARSIVECENKKGNLNGKAE